MTKYKLPLHIKNYVRQELYDYNKNKLLLKDIEKKNSSMLLTRPILIASKKICDIEAVLEKLSKEERELVVIIFFKKTNQAKAETFYYISKDAYYNILNKMLYLTAIEFNLI